MVLLSVDVEVSLPLPHALKTPAKAMIAKNFFIVRVLFLVLFNDANVNSILKFPKI